MAILVCCIFGSIDQSQQVYFKRQLYCLESELLIVTLKEKLVALITTSSALDHVLLLGICTCDIKSCLQMVPWTDLKF